MPRSWYVQGFALAGITALFGALGLGVSLTSTASQMRVVGGLLAGVMFYQTFVIARTMLRDRRFSRKHQARMQEFDVRCQASRKRARDAFDVDRRP